MKPNNRVVTCSSRLAVAVLAIAVAACGGLPSISIQWKETSTTSTTSTTRSSSATTTRVDVEAQARQELERFRRCIDDKIERLYDDTNTRIEKINEEIRRWEATAKFAEDEWMPSPEELDNPEPGTGGWMDVAMVAQLEAAKRINELLDEADQLIADFERQEAQLQAVRDGALPGNVDWSVCAS